MWVAIGADSNKHWDQLGSSSENNVTCYVNTALAIHSSIWFYQIRSTPYNVSNGNLSGQLIEGSPIFPAVLRVFGRHTGKTLPLMAKNEKKKHQSQCRQLDLAEQKAEGQDRGEFIKLPCSVFTLVERDEEEVTAGENKYFSKTFLPNPTEKTLVLAVAVELQKAEEPNAHVKPVCFTSPPPPLNYLSSLLSSEKSLSFFNLPVAIYCPPLQFKLV